MIGAQSSALAAQTEKVGRAVPARRYCIPPYPCGKSGPFRPNQTKIKPDQAQKICGTLQTRSLRLRPATPPRMLSGLQPSFATLIPPQINTNQAESSGINRCREKNKEPFSHPKTVKLLGKSTKNAPKNASKKLQFSLNFFAIRDRKSSIGNQHNTSPFIAACRIAPVRG